MFWHWWCTSFCSQIVNYGCNSAYIPANKLFFCHGKIPRSVKNCKVCPIIRNGDKACFANCRPISILPSFSKMFEKAVSNRLMIFLNNNQILFKNQYGFRLNRCTYMAIMEMQDKISSAIDKGDYAVGIFLTCRKPSIHWTTTFY